MGWPIAIVCILGTTVIGNLVVMRIANDDPSFAVESNYYQKAVAFDSTMGLEQRSVQLGWHSTATFARDSARTTVVITLRDAQQEPVTKAMVTVDAIFNARANEVSHIALRESLPGVYAAPLVVNYIGEWEVRIDAVRPDTSGIMAHFVNSLRVKASESDVGRTGVIPSTSR